MLSEQQVLKERGMKVVECKIEERGAEGRGTKVEKCKVEGLNRMEINKIFSQQHHFVVQVNPNFAERCRSYLRQIIESDTLTYGFLGEVNQCFI